MWKEVAVVLVEAVSQLLPEGAEGNLRQGGQSADWNLNVWPPRGEAGVLPTLLKYWAFPCCR
jgi:hypothetical protein